MEEVDREVGGILLGQNGGIISFYVHKQQLKLCHGLELEL